MFCRDIQVGPTLLHLLSHFTIFPAASQRAAQIIQPTNHICNCNRKWQILLTSSHSVHRLSFRPDSDPQRTKYQWQDRFDLQVNHVFSSRNRIWCPIKKKVNLQLAAEQSYRMSAYAHEMERENSDQSLLTTRDSETGSGYTTEEGIYMSSLAATVLISGLATLGISVFSLLVALTVMLNACERRNSGVLEMYRNAESYDYCRTFALHAEMNSLSADHLPEICMDINTQYIRKGQYRRDLEIAVGIAEDFLTSIGAKVDGRDVVLMDADDFLASGTFYADDRMKDTLVEVNRYSNYLRREFTLKLYLKLISLQWPLILLSRRPEKLRNTTTDYLTSVGCLGWSSLIMRMDNETSVNHEEFLSRQRSMLQRQGFRIKAVISSQMDALRGPYLGDRIFKLPNPVFRLTLEGGDDIQIKRS